MESKQAGSLQGVGRSTRARTTAGERILSVASELFYRRGVQAVGVEEIVKKASVAKITLYRSFSSKDDLVVAWLERRSSEFWSTWDEVLASHSGSPRKQIAVLMAHLADRTMQPGYLGCPFLKFCCEFPPGSHPGRLSAEVAKSEMRRRLHLLAVESGANDPETLGDGLMLLIEGAYGISQTIKGQSSPGRSLQWAANALVAAAFANEG